MVQVDDKHLIELKERFINSSYFKTMGITGIQLEEGQCQLTLDIYESKHLNSIGTVHGGVVASLLDSASGLSIWTSLEPPKSITTINLAINFLRAARKGKLTTIASIKKIGRNIATVEAEVFDEENRTIANGIGTFMIINTKD